jgi:hypothetical protein
MIDTLKIYQFRACCQAPPDIRRFTLQVHALDRLSALEDAASRLAVRFGKADFQPALPGLLIVSQDNDGAEVTWIGREATDPHWIGDFYTEGRR